jgi:RNA polymerase sigma factor (sigma-70 family)
MTPATPRQSALLGSSNNESAWHLGAAIAAETPFLLASARLITSSEAEAWDVVQITIEIGLRRGGSLRDRGAIRAWLLAILSREATRLRRRIRRFVSIDLAEVEVPAVPAPNVEQVAIREALSRLPVRTRAAVVLHHMLGLSIAEVAAAMNVSENTVKSQIRVGISRLREALSDE